ncbi:uncharacterized protein [Diadema antillarum]|uniref:uncharacterized protein n=1 Tax=Diadema antillarum TaxID=105358 RepID=UPI003A88325E
MQIILFLSVLLAVVSGVMSKGFIHQSQRYRGPYFSRPQNNAISSYQPSSGRNVLCRYGAFRRDCCYGWKRNEVGKCTPICEDECVHGVCVGPNRCKCESGWTGPTCSQDYNECSVRPCQHRCMNTPGSYRCYCDHGFLLLNDGRTCTRDDRCYSTRCAFGCVQYEDGFNCFCPDGLRITADGLMCEDIDECAEGTANCPRGRRCSNTYGNYLCLCQEGYKFQYVNGKLACVDDNECAANRGKCDANAYCQNLSGGYRCVCNTGYVGTGERCLPLSLDTCADKPCFEGVRCTNIRIDVNSLDYDSGEPAKRYECGPCPPGFEGTDGINCEARNVDVTILVLEQVGGAPVSGARIRTYDIRQGGDAALNEVFTQLNGVAKIPVPNDASIIVVASKPGHPTTSTSFDVRNNENNLVTLTLTNYNDGVVFPYPLPTTRTFSFSDPNAGTLEVEIPTGGLNMTQGPVSIDVLTVDLSEPDNSKSVPELNVHTGDGEEADKLAALAVAEIAVTEPGSNSKVDLTEAATIRIPVSERFASVQVGDEVPAWYFDEAIGLWVQSGMGTIEESSDGGLVWVYQTEHFTWWAAAFPWPVTQIVTVHTCFTEDCSTVAPNTSVVVWGVNFYYQLQLTTSEDGSALAIMQTLTRMRIIHACSGEFADYDITEDVTDIIFKVPDTANQGCQDPGDIQNGVRRGTGGFTYGAEVTYYCNPDYALHGSSRRVCMPCGDWSGYQPYCELEEYISSSVSSSSPGENTSPNKLFTEEPFEGSGDL